MGRNINNLVTESDDYINIDSQESIDKCLNCTKKECDNCLCGSAAVKRKKSPSKLRIDMTGKRFGRWTVLGPAPTIPGQTSACWECRCDCGTVAVVAGRTLRSGNSKRCKKCYQESRKKGGENNA